MINRLGIACCLSLIVTSAIAQPVDPSREQGLVAISRCMEFAGEPSGLRQWAKKSGIGEAPPDLERAYLQPLHQSGRVYGYASPTGEVALASQDDGGCTVFIEHVDGTALVNEFEHWLDANHFVRTGTNVVERKGRRFSMTSHNYELKQAGRKWRVVISATLPRGAARFDALITVYGTPSRKA